MKLLTFALLLSGCAAFRRPTKEGESSATDGSFVDENNEAYALGKARSDADKPPKKRGGRRQSDVDGKGKGGKEGKGSNDDRGKGSPPRPTSAPRPTAPESPTPTPPRPTSAPRPTAPESPTPTPPQSDKIQYTPDLADWSSYNSKPLLYNGTTAHDPDSAPWIVFRKWDGKVIDPAMEEKAFYEALCGTNKVLVGLREVFYKTKPFADNKNPTKAEVDDWHRVGLNHLRALVGRNTSEDHAHQDMCTFAGAQWGQERKYSTLWDSKYPANPAMGPNWGPCQPRPSGHCGYRFVPNAEDQKKYLPPGHKPCGRNAGSEGMLGANAKDPWSIKFSASICGTIKQEGICGGHVGPWFRRTHFGWAFWEENPASPTSPMSLRGMWAGSRLPQFEHCTEKLLINGKPATWRQKECVGIQWQGPRLTASECFNDIQSISECDDKFMTYNDVNGGCACYPRTMTTCQLRGSAGRNTWDLKALGLMFDSEP